MRRLVYYTPRTPLGRLVAPPAAVTASLFHPRALRPLVKPLLRLGNHARRPGVRRRAARGIDLVVGDGMAIRVRRQRAGRS